MKPFFCRVGSKSKISKKILRLIPPHHTYIEPFFGSGAIFFKKDKSDVEIINDLDKNVINNIKMLKNAEINAENYQLRKSLKQKTELVNSKPVEKTDKLLKALYLSCNTFNSINKGKLYKNSNGKEKIGKINEYVNRLKKVKIYNKDYKNIILKYDDEDSFFFIDPPYENSNNLYKHSNFDYEELRDIMLNIKGFVLLTVNDSKKIRNLFKGFNIKINIVNGNGNKNIGIGKRKELIIMNY